MIIVISKKGFWISSDEEIVPYFFFEKDSNDISSMNILDEINMLSMSKNQIKALISNIINVKNGYDIEYLTSTNMVTFEILQETVIIKNDLFDLPDIIISTDTFLKIIEEKLKFINDLIEINVLPKIKEALINIKKNPVWEKNQGYSIIDKEGVFFRFALNQSVLESINIEEFINNKVIKLD
jgi:hypothetical protein